MVHSENTSLLDSLKKITSSTSEENDVYFQDITPTKKKSKKLTKRQWLTVIVFGIVNFTSAVCISLQSPFYPEEAEFKGASPTEYGFVFGIYELVGFICSPIFGKYLPNLGPKFVFNSGIFLTAGSCVLFGILDMIRQHAAFLGLSFAIRIIEALGTAGTLTSTFAIIAVEFPDSVATTFASLETFFGLGLIAGPTIGGFLYQLGGFILPFMVNGIFLFITGIISLLLLPRGNSYAHSSLTNRNSGLIAILRVPSVLMAALSIVCASISLGFLAATLEPHLRDFQLTPVLMGLVFVVNGGMYGLTAPIAGWICDRGARPKVVAAVGNVLIIIAFLLIGPAPFIPLNTILWMVIIGLFFHGTGVGFLLVSCFLDGLKSSVEKGFPDDISTYSIVSGLWASAFALGAFIGPSVGGILLDYVGFRWGSLLNIVLHTLALIAHIIFIQSDSFRTRPKYTYIPTSTYNEFEPILPGPGPSKNRHRNYSTTTTET